MPVAVVSTVVAASVIATVTKVTEMASYYESSRFDLIESKFAALGAMKMAKSCLEGTTANKR